MAKRIVFSNESSGVSVLVPVLGCGLTVEEIAAKDVPSGVGYVIIEAVDLPVDRVFRGAWEKQGAAVVESLSKCKLIAHEQRRAARAVEFAPHDVDATIPGKAAQAEAAREVIRNKYAAIQDDIDAAATPNDLRPLVAALVV